MATPIIGIMAAMPEEIQGLVETMTQVQETTIGKRVYYSGILNNKHVVVVFSRWGKVAASTTSTTLITKFGISSLIFTGVAGGIHPGVKIGDIVLGSSLIQHDMDARPLMPQFEIPLLGVSFFDTDPKMLDSIQAVVSDMLSTGNLLSAIGDSYAEEFAISAPSLHIGEIASGDKFFASNSDKHQLAELLPNVLCVEMEGAAVAQVCFEYEVPFAIIRTISDTADDTSHIDFPAFVTRISSVYSLLILNQLIQ